VAQVVQRLSGAGAVAARGAARRRTSWREDLVTAGLSAWMIAGGASDGWAHVHAKPDTFLTSWHAAIYSGFAALFAWMIWLSRPARGGVPVGYGLGLAGGVVLLAGSVGDGVWHTVFGIELSFEALLSPTHILLFAGSMLLVATPARAAWGSRWPSAAPTLRDFAPTLLSLTVTTCTVIVFLGHASAFGRLAATRAVSPAAPLDTPPYHIIEQGFMDIQFTNLVLLGVLLLALRRWRLPFGSATVLFAVPVATSVVIWEATNAWLVLAALAGGLVADWCLARSSGPAVGRRTHLLVATATPLALWSSYFLVLHLQHGITWSAELWTGSLLFTLLGGYALHLLMLPPLAPQTAEQRPTAGSGRTRPDTQ
jgi:hypothetical protein